MELYNDNIQAKSSIKYEKTDVNELDKNRIVCQIQKTGNTIFHIKNVDIQIQNLKIPISQLNYLRREAIKNFEVELENSIKREYNKNIESQIYDDKVKKCVEPKINLYVQKFNPKINYSKLKYHQIYIPFKDLINGSYIRNCIAVLPVIIDEAYEELIQKNLHIFDKCDAIMISHLSQIELLKKFHINKKIVADYTLNITNNFLQNVVKELGIQRFTFSPELDKNSINQFSDEMEKEIVVYGRTCLMTSKYCIIGKNKNCKKACQQGNYELKDRKNFIFPVVADCINCHTKIYNSKILSVHYDTVNVNFVRADILDETEDEIKLIMDKLQKNERFCGQEYTNGNLC